MCSDKRYSILNTKHLYVIDVPTGYLRTSAYTCNTLYKLVVLHTYSNIPYVVLLYMNIEQQYCYSMFRLNDRIGSTDMRTLYRVRVGWSTTWELYFRTPSALTNYHNIPMPISYNIFSKRFHRFVGLKCNFIISTAPIL
jgi:hypothetical protein